MFKIYKCVFISTLLALLSIISINRAIAETKSFSKDASYEVCFTPGQNCTQLIVDYLNKAKKSIYVQAYSFTSAPIAKAIVNANQRGVDVKVILDKSQIKNNRYSSAKFLINHEIPIWIDYKPAIAHNKVMILDNQTVITGSFNFTKAAQMKNAENLLIISDHKLSTTYNQNWTARQSESKSAIYYK